MSRELVKYDEIDTFVLNQSIYAIRNAFVIKNGLLDSWFYGISTFVGLFNAEVNLFFSSNHMVSSNYSYLIIIIIYFFHHTVIWFQVYTYPTTASWEECDTRSIFKGSKSDLNSEFFFSWTGCLTKDKEPYLPYYLLIS